MFFRKWIIENFFKDDFDMVQKEFVFCNYLADLYRCHYGLWQYRRFLIDFLGPKVCFIILFRLN